jgi:hypothetical protein
LDQEQTSTPEVTEQTPPSTPAETPAGNEDDAAFGAGFREARGEEERTTPLKQEDKPETHAATPAEEDAASKETATTDASATATTPPEDEWAGVSPKVRKEIEAMSSKLGSVDKINEQLRTISGHIGGLTQSQRALKDALAQATTSTKASGAAAPTQQQVQDATKSTAKWNELKQDYPDWAEAIDLRLAEMTAKLTPAAPSVDVPKLTADFEARLKQAEATAEERAVTARTYGYIDSQVGRSWMKDVNSPEFDKWIATQPDDVKQLAASAEPDDAIALVKKFREGRAKTATKDQLTSRLKRAATPTGTAVVDRTIDDDDAFASGFKAARGT